MSSTMWLQGLAIGMNLLTGQHMPTLDRAKTPATSCTTSTNAKTAAGSGCPTRSRRGYWAPFAEALGIEYVLEDPEIEGGRDGSASPRLLEIVEDQFASKTFAEWDSVFRQYGVHLCESADDRRSAERSAGAGERLHSRFRPPCHRPCTGCAAFRSHTARLPHPSEAARRS